MGPFAYLLEFLSSLFPSEDATRNKVLQVLSWKDGSSIGVEFDVIARECWAVPSTAMLYSWYGKDELRAILDQMVRDGLITQELPGAINMHERINHLYKLTKKGRAAVKI